MSSTNKKIEEQESCKKKIEPLATNQRVMTWLCMRPADESTSKQSIAMHIAFIITVCTFEFCCLMSSGVFFVKFVRTEFEASLYGFFQVAGHTPTFVAIIVALAYRQRIAAIFTKLSEIYTARKYTLWF